MKKKQFLIILIINIFIVFHFHSQGKNDLNNIPGKKYFKNISRTKYFNIYYNKLDKINYYKDFLDGFIEYINKEFLKFEYDYPINVCILSDNDEFRKFLKREIKYTNLDIFGVFFYKYNVFYTYDGSGIGTLAHEIMHPLINKNFPNRPKWADEAITTFFEKFFGYLNNEKLFLEIGFQNPWRIKKYKDRIKKIDLYDIITKNENYEYQSDLRLITIFMHKNGVFKDFLNLLKKKDKKGYKTYFEAAFKMNYKEIEPEWKKYTTRILENTEKIYKIPGSKIFYSKTEFEDFMKKNDLYFLKKF